MDSDAVSRLQSVPGSSYLGLFLVAMTTLMYEVLLTRIFSATIWYHYGFLAISVAMFGMTFGAILVYLFPSVFTRENAPHVMGLTTLAFAVSLVGALFTQLCIPFYPVPTVLGAFSVLATAVILAIPFTFSGMTVAIALTKFPERVGSLYAADLCGAAIGCLALFSLLNLFDGLSTTIVIGCIASVAAMRYASIGRTRKLLAVSAATAVVFGLSGAFFGMKSRDGHAPLRVMWVKGRLAETPIYEKWNSYSRVAIHGDPNVPRPPEGWGLSSKFSYEPIPQLLLDIDAGAGTRLTRFNGDITTVDFLRRDVTSLVHYLRPLSDVLIVGSGGGRDVLTAMLFDQSSIRAVEMNPEIVHAVNNVFGDFTGHLDRDSRVEFVVDEARSYLARTNEKFDILQISLIDTWAATAAGAFVLSENSLYTVEAYRLFLARLKEDGIMSVSRRYQGSNPGEMLRLTALAAQSLIESGAENPREHIIIVRSAFAGSSNEELHPDGVATLLVSRRPFSRSDLETMERVVGELGFEMILSPRSAGNELFERLADPEAMDATIASYSLNLIPPTDNSPFFFNMLRFRDIFNSELRNDEIGRAGNLKAVYVLGVLVIVVVGMTGVLLLPPMLVTWNWASMRRGWLYIIYFALIGLGFMLIEVSQMQRLIVFLGHPMFGLTVVLFAILVSSGIGSLLSERVRTERLASRGPAVLGGLIIILVTYALVSPVLMDAFASSITPVRILVSVALLFPVGLFLGTAFPLGLRAAARENDKLGPFLWAVNGSTSVCASVLATAVSLSASISASFWLGVVVYFGAALAFTYQLRSRAVG